MPPADIENKSFEIITRELGDRQIPPDREPILKRVIHTTADFDYVENLYFSDTAVAAGKQALLSGAHIVTDTKMAMAGINKTKLHVLGGKAHCFISDEDVASEAKALGITRAAVSMERASTMKESLIFAIGNAPTALLRLRELIDEGLVKPELVIAVPVGFVNVVESKQIIKASGVPCIVAEGRKGGSNVAAAICNAFLYELVSR